ncbi:Putative RNA polymerase II subunit B1 CTD phosphatase RPAP2 [Anthophora plagiata]
MDTSTMKKEALERKKVKKKMSKAQMQLAIIKKKQCDAKALMIVEQLLEPKIDSEWLLCNLRYINKSHMEDVIEERAIVKLCGYVLCNNALITIIGQRYHISTKKNKVYDVTRRKNFCSSRCYGACNYLLEQMLTSPLWLRDKEEIPEFKVLPPKHELVKSVPGDEIHVQDINMVLSPDNKEKNVENNATCRNSIVMSPRQCSEINVYNEHNIIEIDHENTEINNIIEKSDLFREESWKNFDNESKDMKNLSTNLEDKNNSVQVSMNDSIVKEISTPESTILLNDTMTQVTTNLHNDATLNEDMENKKEESKLLETLKTEGNITITKQDTNINNKDCVSEVEKTENKKHQQKNSVKVKQLNEFYNLAVHIEQNIKEWITEDTLCLLSGEEDIKHRLLENIVQHDRYLHLCKKLNKLQLEDEKDDHTDLTTDTLKPLPHLSVLQEEGKKMELKVRAFYKGSVIIENPVNTAEDTGKDDNFTPILPLTDAHAPKTLRRRIFLDKLSRILPDLLKALTNYKLPQNIYNEKSALIKALVNTFSLSAGNITFKTAEWTLVGLIIIKMLSMIDPQLKILLSTKQASMYISMILMSYKLDSNYLDRLVMELINNTNVLNTDNAANSNAV